MPLLMFLSGLVLSRSLDKTLGRYYLGKLRGIVWPNVVWIVVYGVVAGPDRLSSWETWFTGTWLWYLTYLAAYYAAAPIVRKLPTWWVPIALWGVSVVVPAGEWTQFFVLAAFFFVGDAVWRRRVALSQWDTVWFRVTAVVIAVVYSIFFTLRAYDERVPVVFSRYDPLAAPLVLVALAGLIVVARTIPDAWTSALRFLGRNSIVFYVVHFPLQILWTAWLASLLVWDWQLHVVGGVILALVVGALLALLRRVPVVDALFVMPLSERWVRRVSALGARSS